MACVGNYADQPGDALGLALTELEQSAGNLDAAVAVVEQLDPSTIAAVSLCELYGAKGQHDAVVDSPRRRNSPLRPGRQGTDVPSENKGAMARKDLERVLAEDAEYPGVHELLASI